ncbi:type II toxin-antitoxin system VapC family toxin [Neorhizobium sp. JUb45]|uniref:type II toxin-antitoxin system VapC family toxin n=1 Tax=Neorhizobium sp. JUb45 TaxID=2485113 RepID=UPI0010444B0D|nr:type II toxin-antitoxin system VapC family toxin [Neorhizobium sp. JUb45]TCR06918.1 hypothetical protein EDF70_101881 [Neorhizobium sp. JUb45]
MTPYLDTSVIVALLTGETSAARIRLWMTNRTSSTIMISDWSLTEVSSALSLKQRTGQITAQASDAARKQFQIFLESSFEILPVSGQHFYKAARYCDRHDLGLRAGDALHLAIAVEAHAELITLDKRFAAAAQTFGARYTLL